MVPAVPETGGAWDALSAVYGADPVRYLGTVDLGDEGLEIFGAPYLLSKPRRRPSGPAPSPSPSTRPSRIDSHILLPVFRRVSSC